MEGGAESSWLGVRRGEVAHCAGRGTEQAGDAWRPEAGMGARSLSGVRRKEDFGGIVGRGQAVHGQSLQVQLARDLEFQAEDELFLGLGIKTRW